VFQSDGVSNRFEFISIVRLDYERNVHTTVGLKTLEARKSIWDFKSLGDGIVDRFFLLDCQKATSLRQDVALSRKNIYERKLSFKKYSVIAAQPFRPVAISKEIVSPAVQLLVPSPESRRCPPVLPY
jgi:hypothetical protein